MKGRIGEFKAQYDNNCKLRVEGKDIDALNGIDIQDAAILGEHELSGIFKLYLRNLAPVNPIFTLEQMAALKDMTKVTTKISAIHEAVNTFPKIRGKAVTLIFDFFPRISQILSIHANEPRERRNCTWAESFQTSGRNLGRIRVFGVSEGDHRGVARSIHRDMWNFI